MTDAGGTLPRGPTWARNDTGHAERVLRAPRAWQPGDFAVVRPRSLVGDDIDIAERLAGYKGGFVHAFVAVDDGNIVEAEPHGAVCHPFHYDPYGVEWSTGRLVLTPAERSAIVAAAMGYVGTPYSFLDHAAIAAHRFHLWAPGLQRYVKSTRHMICSQLVAQCYADAGVDLFPGRWPGFVVPDDLAAIIGVT